MSLIYEWRAGYEVLTIKHARGGTSDYGVSYHPNVYCEGDGICIRCGRTLFD